MGNWFKTTLLLGSMTALIVLVGRMFGGEQGMIFAFILAMGMNLFSYWYSDRIVLRMYRAREASPREHPQLHGIVQRLAERAGIPMPRIFIIPEKSPNAFATGRNPKHAVVAVTEGLLELMDRDEVAGVLAHELAHVRNRDILIGSIAATMAGAIMILASMARWTAFLGGGSEDDEGGPGVFGLIAMSILAPMAAMLVQMAVSRSREYHADASGSAYLGDSGALADALEKLGSHARRRPMQAKANTAHMFIVNPLSGRRLANLFSTHPPLEERIARLRGRRTDPVAPGISGTKQPSGEDRARDAWRGLSG
ncbi:MAG: zinc metalloprotease HtpX [Deltaproteobacteria bacterium]|nr:zinc metalloprotease HtpX [Deltaproteobacteria bacterium]